MFTVSNNSNQNNDFFSLKTKKKALILLSLFHILIIAASNYLVQYPVTIFSIETNWGTFTFPFIFLATDLTIRVFGKILARKIIFVVMFPALIVSYIFSIVFDNGAYVGFANISTFDISIFRIVIASFAAYSIGQLLDITVFNALRQKRAWWVAPFFATIIGGALDTFAFYAIAFYHGQDVYMAQNWVSQAFVDYLWKMTVSILLFLPLYGIILNYISRYLLNLGAVSKTS